MCNVGLLNLFFYLIFYSIFYYFASLKLKLEVINIFLYFYQYTIIDIKIIIISITLYSLLCKKVLLNFNIALIDYGEKLWTKNF